MKIKEIRVYNRSYDLALEIHKYFIKQDINKRFIYDLIDQLLRSTKSIPANIAEGYGKRESQKDFVRFLWIAVGSKGESLVHLEFLKDLKFLDENNHKKFTNELEEIGKMLFGMIDKIKVNSKNK